MDAYNDVALGVEAAWPIFVLALAQAFAPTSPIEPVQAPAAEQVAGS